MRLIKYLLLTLPAALLVLLALSLGSCSAVKMADVVVSQPELRLESYFAGRTRAHGVLLDRSGAAQRHFTVDILGTWDANTRTLTLDEKFVFNDGERSQRIWTIRKQDASHYTGTAADVVGDAQGEVKGNAFRWEYVLQVPYQGKTLDINFEDWMFLGENNVLLNRAVMRKFGFKVGEIVISFEKL